MWTTPAVEKKSGTEGSSIGQQSDAQLFNDDVTINSSPRLFFS